MERFANNIVAKMKTADLISEDEIEIYRYGVLVVLERSMSYALIFVLALILHCVLEIALFLSSFSILRKFSGGIHCRSYGLCLITSILVSFSSLIMFSVACHNYSLYQEGVIMSFIIVIIIGAINNPNIDWSDCEYRKARRLSRMIAIFEASVLLLFMVIGAPFKIRFYISYGIVACAISMLLEIRKRGGMAYEECRETALEGSKSSCKEAD